MNIRIEEWLDQMRQTREPGPLVRVVVVRSGRSETWTFDVDVTEKTDLDDLAPPRTMIAGSHRGTAHYGVTESTRPGKIPFNVDASRTADWARRRFTTGSASSKYA